MFFTAPDIGFDLLKQIVSSSATGAFRLTLAEQGQGGSSDPPHILLRFLPLET
jgi:hypothetical protein